MKTIVFFTGLMICAVCGKAQTNHYTETKTFYEPGYTYQCDVIGSGEVVLYNKNNKWTNIYQIDTTTGEYYVSPEYDYIPLFEDDDWTWTENKRDSIVNNAFPAAMKQWIKGHDFITTIYINSTTGKVDEVEFSLFYPFTLIPAWVYRKIEVDLKNLVWFRPTAEGKKLNYILLWWGQEPK